LHRNPVSVYNALNNEPYNLHPPMNFPSFSLFSFGSFTLALAGVGFGQGGWTTETPIGLARGYLGVAAHEGFIYAVGGAHSGGIRTDRVERFDPQTHVWTQLAPLPITRSEFGLAVLNGQLIAAGGEDSGGQRVGLISTTSRPTHGLRPLR